MSARMMARLACVVGIAICTFGYSRCAFVSGDPPPDIINPPPVGGENFNTHLTLHNSNGTQTTDFVMGEPIRFDLETLNHSTRTQTLHFPDTQIYDFWVFDALTYNVRWRWSADKAFLQVATELTFLPNTSKRYVVTWDGVRANGGQLPAGSYVARGIIVSDTFTGEPMATNELASPLVTFTVH